MLAYLAGIASFLQYKTAHSLIALDIDIRGPGKRRDVFCAELRIETGRADPKFLWRGHRLVQGRHVIGRIENLSVHDIEFVDLAPFDS